ncbi:RNA methyltransferase [Spiroplasma endosymbiont of Agriotes lineatus]|uniref:TrmH family RNA methyltransferase n=1 Tax=Spiroplasma endosymbiont of Agriotes lineatus TaxID=3077930 RepID=UPI0030D4C291
MKIINSINNFLIKDLVKLKESKYRKEKEQFLIEGFHLIEEAKKQNKLLMILATQDIANKIEDFINIITVNEQIIKKISATVSPQPIIGVCSFLDYSYEVDKNLVVMLDKIQDPTNLGNIVRSCVAFGVQTLYISNDSVDIYNDKVIRTSMGAIFHLNIIKTNLELVIASVKDKGFKVYGTVFKEANNRLRDVNFNNQVALLFGNEGKGINSHLWPLIDDNFYIPTSNGVESLNVANALTISLYEIMNQN